MGSASKLNNEIAIHKEIYRIISLEFKKFKIQNNEHPKIYLDSNANDTQFSEYPLNTGVIRYGRIVSFTIHNDKIVIHNGAFPHQKDLYVNISDPTCFEQVSNNFKKLFKLFLEKEKYDFTEKD